MLPHQLERVRNKSADMMRSYLAVIRGIHGNVAMAHVAKGVLDELTAALIPAAGEKEAYRIIVEGADRIVELSDTSDFYLSSSLDEIIRATKKSGGEV